jgi:OOP family OmpA-OmpF porin
MRTRTLLLVTAALVSFVATRPTAAQAPGFALNRFEPSERGSDWFVNDSLDLRGATNVATGVVFDWSYKPLVLHEGGEPQARAVGDVVTDAVFAHAGASFMFHDRFRFALNLPLALYQHGDDVSQVARAVRAPQGASVGDLRLSADARVIGLYGDVFTAALGFQLHLPTGRRSQLTSDGVPRFTPRVLIAGDGEGLLYAAKLGFAYRPLDDSFEGRRLGSEAVFSLAAGVRVNDLFVLGPELYGSTVVTGGTAFSARATPLELLLGLHVTLGKHWLFGSGIGPGFTRGDGTPSMRVLFSMEFAPDVCVDKDGDGICAPMDACPDVDGVRTGERSTNGCPGDRDRDGISDKDDACREKRGVRSDDASKNGCPPGTEREPPKAVPPD